MLQNTLLFFLVTLISSPVFSKTVRSYSPKNPKPVATPAAAEAPNPQTPSPTQPPITPPTATPSSTPLNSPSSTGIPVPPAPPVPTPAPTELYPSQFDHAPKSNTPQPTTEATVVAQPSTEIPPFFSELDLSWRYLSENSDPIAKNLSGSILIGYQLPSLFSLEGFSVSLRYQPTYVVKGGTEAIAHGALLGLGYELGINDQLYALGRAELGANLMQHQGVAGLTIPQKLLETGFNAQIGAGIRYYPDLLDFKHQLAVGFNVISNLGSFSGVSFGPSIILFI